MRNGAEQIFYWDGFENQEVGNDACAIEQKFHWDCFENQEVGNDACAME